MRFLRYNISMERLNGMRVIAAVSGGADSVALLLRLLEKRGRGEIALIAAHVEHGIRSAASEADMHFVIALCEKYRVPLFVKRVDVPAYAKAAGIGTETAARELRYRFFDELLNATGFDRVALAHHADDQAETVLMHILRGASLSGARGMAFDTGKYVRPLLTEPKDALLAYLAGKGETFRQDETNFIADNPRNALRQALAFYPGARDAILRFSRFCAEDDDYLKNLSDAEEKTRTGCFDGGVWIDRTGLPKVLFGRIAVKYLPEPEERTVALLFSLQGKTQLPGGLTALGDGGRLYLYRETEKPEPVPLNVPGSTVLWNGSVITVTESGGEICRDNGLRQTVNRNALAGAVARLRLDGDRIRPFGMTGTKLLSDYLTDRKVAKPLRDTVPVIACGREILWVPGVGLSENMRAQRGFETYTIEIGRKEP